MTLFSPAARTHVFFKGAITGPAGSTKTWSALALATGLSDKGKIAVIDTENSSASLYADKFRFDSLSVEPPYTDSKFIQAISNAVSERYSVLIIDSFSHAWQGILDYKAALDAKGGNSYFHWNQAGAKYNAILAAVLHSPIHIIACLRSKMDYVVEPDSKGKQVPRKIGLAPVSREGTEYEFTTVFDGDLEHHVTTTKDRTGLFVDQRFQITEETGSKLLGWLKTAPAAAAPVPPPPSEPSIQQRLQDALYGLHADWIHDFLVDRKKIVAGQTVFDLSADYATEALSRITEFRDAIIAFGNAHDVIGVDGQQESAPELAREGVPV